MDKTFSDLMDIVNRSKKYDTDTPKPRAKKTPSTVVEEYKPREYDIVEEKPKRKTATSSAAKALSNSKLGELVSKTTKKTTTKTSTKSTAKKPAEKKTPAKSTTAKSTTAKKTTTKKTAPKSDALSALMNKVNTTKKTATKKEQPVEKDKPVILDTADEVIDNVSNDTAQQPTAEKETVKSATKFEFEARPKVKPAKSLTDKEPASDKDAQLFAALKNSLFAGGTDISDYLYADEVDEMSQQNYEENFSKQEADKLNDEISKEQQEYEQLFTGSFSSFYDMADNEEENTETFARDEKKPHDSTYELDTGSRNLDQKIADYYKRKQEMIDKYNAEEEDFVEEKKEDENAPVDYDAIFGGSMMSRDEVLGMKNRSTEQPTEEQIPEQNAEENTVFGEYLARNTVNELDTDNSNTTTVETVEEPVAETVTTAEEPTIEETVETTTAAETDYTTVAAETEMEEVVEDNNSTPYQSAFGEVEVDTVEDTTEETYNNTNNEPVVNGDNFSSLPSEQPAGEVMEYSNQVPVDFSSMTTVEDIVTEEPVEEPVERKSLLSAFVSNKNYQPVEDDDDEELVIRLDNNEFATEEVVNNQPYQSAFGEVEEDTVEETTAEEVEAETEMEEDTVVPPVFGSINDSLDDDNSIVVDSENTISSLELEESLSAAQPVEEVEDNSVVEDTTDSEEDNTTLTVESLFGTPDNEETATVESTEDRHSALFYPEEQPTAVEEEITDIEENDTETINAVEDTAKDNIEDTTEESVEEAVEETTVEDIVTEKPAVEETINNTVAAETMEQNSEEENLLETYLSEDEHYDYIVTNERLFEENNRPQTQNIVEDYINDTEDNTIVMNDIPNTTFDFFKSITTDKPAEATEAVVETVATEPTVEETTTEEAHSKDEFLKEMARLQDNLVSELQGNIVEKSSYDFFAEKEPTPAAAPVVEPTTVVTDTDSKANSLVDELISAVEEDTAPSIVEQVMAKSASTETVTETTQVTETVAETTTAVTTEDNTPAEEERPAEDSLVGSQAEPVDPADFDKYNLLNKTVALNEEDLKATAVAPQQPAQDTYFYGSNEDKEKKAQVIDEYMTIYNEEAHYSKEVGDINIFKSIGNAVPSSEILKEDTVEPTNNTDTEEDSELETIYTLMGIQRKPAATKQQEIKVLYCASECQPFAASGGLADVAGSLPKAIAEKGNVDIRVIMPLYGNIKAEYRDKFEYLGNFTVHLSWRQEYCGLFRYFKDGVTYYFIDNERYFKRDTLYGYYDDGERFAYFSKAIVEALPHLNFFPDIIHCNDWQTALVSAFIKTENWADHRYYKMKFVYTIHNVEYQGIYGMENLKDLFGIDYRFKNDVEYNGDINLTKTAIQYCDKLTTVSHSYCENLKQPYCSRGLHHIIIRNEYKLSGIINGIDYSFYNPATDPNLFKNYDIGCLEEKVLNKKLWQDEIGLPVDGETPMIAIVSRLVGHKGLDLVAKIVHNILQQDIQLVVVGTGEDKYVDLFHSLEQKYPTKVRAFVDKYSNEIARKAYAASDIFVMPSKIEPCGLSQMISSRYGSVPIVREVGGLKDTIRDFGCEGGGNGYTFANYNANDLQYQIERAIKDYSNRSQWREKMKICMSQDYTWGKPAISYIDLYKSINSN